MRSALAYNLMTTQLDSEIGIAAATQLTSCAWPDPTPLPDALPPVAPFDLAVKTRTKRHHG